MSLIIFLSKRKKRILPSIDLSVRSIFHQVHSTNSTIVVSLSLSLIPSTPVKTLKKVYQFPIVTLANYHQCNGLNNTNLFCCNSRGQKSNMGLTKLNHNVNKAAFLLEALGPIPFFAFSTFWKTLAFHCLQPLLPSSKPAA